MRRKERAVTELATIKEFVAGCEVARIAFFDQPAPYIVPVNVAHEWQDDQLIFYFHGAQSGKKLTLLAQNPQVGIELDRNHELISGGSKGCNYSYAYQSLIGSGKAEVLTDNLEKQQVLERLLHQIVPETEFDGLPVKMVAKTAVVKITVAQFTVKENRPRS